MKKIVKSDTVVVLTGNDRGKTGKILKVFPDKRQAVVEGVNLIKRHSRPTKDLPQGGIVYRDAEPSQGYGLKRLVDKWKVFPMRHLVFP